MTRIPIITAICLFVLATAAPQVQAQWQLCVQGGYVGAGGRVEPASTLLSSSLRGGVSLGGGLEYRLHPCWTLSAEAAYREHGVQRYYREVLVEDHRYGCLDATLVLRWMPLPGTLRPVLAGGCGFSTPLSATIQYGFHDRYNFLDGTEALRVAVPHLRLGGGFNLDFNSGVALRTEVAWQTALADLYAPTTSEARSFFISEVIILLSLGMPLG